MTWINVTKKQEIASGKRSKRIKGRGFGGSAIKVGLRDKWGLTRPAMGVGSLLIFFTRLGLIELSNLIKDTEGRGHHKLNFNYWFSHAFKTCLHDKLRWIFHMMQNKVSLNQARAEWNNCRQKRLRVCETVCVRVCVSLQNKRWGTKREKNIFWGSHSGVWEVYDRTDPKSELRISASPCTHWELLTSSSALHIAVNYTCKEECPSAVTSHCTNIKNTTFSFRKLQ